MRRLIVSAPDRRARATSVSVPSGTNWAMSTAARVATTWPDGSRITVATALMPFSGLLRNAIPVRRTSASASGVGRVDGRRAVAEPVVGLVAEGPEGHRLCRVRPEVAADGYRDVRRAAAVLAHLGHHGAGAVPHAEHDREPDAHADVVHHRAGEIEDTEPGQGHRAQLGEQDAELVLITVAALQETVVLHRRQVAVGGGLADAQLLGGRHQVDGVAGREQPQELHHPRHHLEVAAGDLQPVGGGARTPRGAGHGGPPCVPASSRIAGWPSVYPVQRNVGDPSRRMSRSGRDFLSATAKLNRSGDKIV